MNILGLISQLIGIKTLRLTVWNKTQNLSTKKDRLCEKKKGHMIDLVNKNDTQSTCKQRICIKLNYDAHANRESVLNYDVHTKY